MSKHIPKFGISQEKKASTFGGGLFKSLISKDILAEWTGLEPATPGVTGRGMKSMFMRVCGLFHIPKFPDFSDSFTLKDSAYSKV